MWCHADNNSGFRALSCLTLGLAAWLMFPDAAGANPTQALVHISKRAAAKPAKPPTPSLVTKQVTTAPASPWAAAAMARPFGPAAPVLPPQSRGLPWQGRLGAAARLPEGQGYTIRRPARTFGTSATVMHTWTALLDFRNEFPQAHVLAVGDLSVERGGKISMHASHQSGRDVDLGLIYQEAPPNYPLEFVKATPGTLHVAATWGLIRRFLRTAPLNGGVQFIFLDYRLQALLFAHAQASGATADELAQWFQYPRGKRADVGIIRHVPNHDDHLHVRFRCEQLARSCR